jgi:LPPG:FO 2-phospho-L-lactate transferase
VSVTALSGGVGGAKLAFGLSRVLDASELTIIANTGDDFEHLGLTICPDLDTLMYTLAGVVNAETGWGRADETWSFMASMAELGGPTWFRLGDKDLATHIFRTEQLRRGESLSAVTEALVRAFRVGPRLVPMSDEPVRTFVDTDEGVLAFQEYFVRERCRPKVRGFRYQNAEGTRIAAGFERAVLDASVVVVCPSNPFVSIDPILWIRGAEELIKERHAPVVAVSPLVANAAIKGPLAKMIVELGEEPTALWIARRYQARDLIDGFVLDRQDHALEGAIRELGLEVLVTDTVMQSAEDKVRLAREVLAFARALDPGNPRR